MSEKEQESMSLRHVHRFADRISVTVELKAHFKSNATVYMEGQQ